MLRLSAPTGLGSRCRPPRVAPRIRQGCQRGLAPTRSGLRLRRRTERCEAFAETLFRGLNHLFLSVRMREAGCLIIDDHEAALSNMSDLGREIVELPTRAIRAAAAAYAARRGWSVVQHGAYVEWASDLMARERSAWLVLDPLFPIRASDKHLYRIRLSRRFENNASIVIRQWAETDGFRFEDLSLVPGAVGLVDDAAASGGTLRHVAQTVLNSGRTVSHILLAASAEGARNALPESARDARWAEFFRGDWRIIHLRDGCPHLPHSGRPANHPLVSGIDGTAVECRIASTGVAGNLWQVLDMDVAVHSAISVARSEIVRKFSDVLGRPALVRDLSLLGGQVPAIVRPDEVTVADATLESLLIPSHSLRP
jgi:hypothetical protein